MRMWMVNPKFHCTQHLLGAHVETHMLLGSILKGNSLIGYIENHLIEPQNLFQYHADLAFEMITRGMQHKSPLNLPNNFLQLIVIGYVDKNESLNELIKRCPKCRKRILLNGDEI